MRVRVRRVVTQPPEAVFAVLADMDGPLWPGHVQHVAGRGASARYHMVQQVGTHQVATDLVLVHLEPPWRLAWRSEHEALAHEADVRLVPHGDGTRIVQTDVEHWHRAPWWTRLLARGSVRRELQRRLALVEQELDRREAERTNGYRG